MRDDVQIAPWEPADRDQVIELILGIQRDELGLITVDGQPDLVDVDAGYRSGVGEFLVARRGDRVLGTIAATVVEPNTVAIRTLFVDRDHRGAGGLAAALLDRLVEWCRHAGYRTMLLGTTEGMGAAHRFAETHGFHSITAAHVPAEFPRMQADSVFHRRDLTGVVCIRDHDPMWSRVFEVQRARIAAAFPEGSVTIEHTGSTSVPGLAAKPIIDITMTVPDPTDEAAYVVALESIGYTFHLREPEWHEHRLLHRDWPRVNLHVFSTGSDEVERMLRFRDHLRRNIVDRDLYADAKRALATREWDDVQDYADAKTDVVADIMSRTR
jgi:GrpB-like predicted nucleotidyltransferase (UPF0157 family)/GNAT superfamily N-acetyltransferase